jgi:hypothetical protein
MPINREKLKTVMMPRDSVFYEDCPIPDQWFLLARAFQECCVHLFGEMIEDKISGTFHHAKAAVCLFEQAVELFFKAGIAQAGKQVPGNHKLHQLYGDFKNLYPETDFVLTASVDAFVAPSEKYPHNQYARYPTDLTGIPWQVRGHTFIDLARFYEQASLFLEDFNRLWPLMKARYSLPQTTTGSALDD